MEQIVEVFKWILDHGPELIAGLVGLLTAVIAIATILPGDEPEKTLQKILDFLKKFSRKP